MHCAGPNKKHGAHGGGLLQSLSSLRTNTKNTAAHSACRANMDAGQRTGPSIRTQQVWSPHRPSDPPAACSAASTHDGRSSKQLPQRNECHSSARHFPDLPICSKLKSCTTNQLTSLPRQPRETSREQQDVGVRCLVAASRCPCHLSNWGTEAQTPCHDLAARGATFAAHGNTQHQPDMIT